MNFTGGVIDVLIEGNTIRDFRIAGSGHTDMIQFWGGECQNVTMRGNILDAGDGPWTQGIFDQTAGDTAPTAIILSGSTNNVIEDNIVPWNWNHKNSNPNDLIVTYGNPDHERSVENLFVNGLAGANATLDDLRAVSGGLIEQLGVGSSMTRSD